MAASLCHPAPPCSLGICFLKTPLLSSPSPQPWGWGRSAHGPQQQVGFLQDCSTPGEHMVTGSGVPLSPRESAGPGPPGLPGASAWKGQWQMRKRRLEEGSDSCKVIRKVGGRADSSSRAPPLLFHSNQDQSPGSLGTGVTPPSTPVQRRAGVGGGWVLGERGAACLLVHS